MLISQLLPAKFISSVIEITLAGLLLATKNAYPNDIPQASFIIGSLMIILFTVIQIVITLIGINIFKNRIHFENTLFNAMASILMIWFILSAWKQSYIWYIWGFFWQFIVNVSVYPIFNEVFGMISIIFHSRKVIFQKYRPKT